MTAAVTSIPETVQQGRTVSSPPQSLPTTTKEKSLSLSKEALLESNSGLPNLRASHSEIDKTKPLPTSLQSEFIPEEILSALTQLPGPSVKEKLGTPSRVKNGTQQNQGKSKGMAANLWHYPHQRKKFQHLTDQPVSLKGAGRDISFLYDVALVEPPLSKTNSKDPSSIRMKERPKEEAMVVSDTLIPSEYHIVKSKGVQHLEFQDDKYTTNLVDDDQNMVKFPSMNPTSRYEVLQLKEALDAMLVKSGVKDEEVEVKGPTQMHNLLEVIKKEQNIYNVIFHELIRQVTVECVERGELLARVRELYNQLLDKVPRQIKSLHQEVMAQRALDRRLTEELFRFKSSIAQLTNELSDVKEHDKVVTSQAQQAQDQLARALAEAEKNASLLNEYHELYELQRKRLEAHVTNLATEREQWSNASYSLAIKVTEANSLATARRLHVSEKAWSKLANHFTVVLSDRDTEQLSHLQGFIARHRELVIKFDESLQADDQKSHERLTQVRLGIEKWIEHFEGAIVASEHVHTVVSVPSVEMIQSMYDDMRLWQQILNKEVEKFGGDVLLTREDSLEQIQKQVDSWTETALQVFNRHKPNDGSENPNQEKLENMISLTQECQKLHKQYQIRVNGENGTARGFINVQNSIESWDTKLNTILNGGPMPLEAEWSRLYELFLEWVHTIEEVDFLIGTTKKEEEKAEAYPQLDKDIVFQDAQKWLSNTINGIDSQDSKLVEQVSVLHAEMVHWMIQVLLRLAPNPIDSPQEIIDSCMSTAMSYAEIREKAATLFDHLTSFSNYITSCCANIVAEEVQRRQDEGDEDFDHEFRDLKKLKSECADWIHTATILMEELKNYELAKLQGTATPFSVTAIGEETRDVGDEQDMPPVESRVELVGEELTPVPSTEPSKQTPAPETIPQTPAMAPTRETSATAQTRATSSASQVINMNEMQVLGHDQNVWTQSLEEPTQPPKSAGLSVAEGSRSPNTPDTNKAYEALAAVQTLQTKLLASEEKCQELEERNTQLEDELLQTQEKLRALERTNGTPRVTPQPDDPQKTPSPAPLVKDIPQETSERPPSGTKSPAAGSKTPAKASPTPPQTPRSLSQRPSSQASGRSATSSRASTRSKKSK